MGNPKRVFCETYKHSHFFIDNGRENCDFFIPGSLCKFCPLLHAVNSGCLVVLTAFRPFPQLDRNKKNQQEKMMVIFQMLIRELMHLLLLQNRIQAIFDNLPISFPLLAFVVRHHVYFAFSCLACLFGCYHSCLIFCSSITQ